MAFYCDANGESYIIYVLIFQNMDIFYKLTREYEIMLESIENDTPSRASYQKYNKLDYSIRKALTTCCKLLEIIQKECEPNIYSIS